MHLLVTNIQWDTDGESLEECRLPSAVLIVNFRIHSHFENDDEERVGDLLSEAYGFCHNGFTWERFGKVHDTHAGGGFFPERLGVIVDPHLTLEDAASAMYA